MEPLNPDEGFSAFLGELAVLCIEADTKTRANLVKLLAGRFRKVHVAADGEEGLSLFRTFKPDLVISDICMQCADAVPVFIAVRSINAVTPIVITAEAADLKNVADAISVGVDHYVLKPVSKERFEQVVEKSVEGLYLKRLCSASERHYRQLVDDSPLLICRFRVDGRISFANSSLARALGKVPEEIVGKPLTNWMSEDQRRALEYRVHLLADQVDSLTSEICITRPDGERAWWVWSERAIYDDSGTLVEVHAFGRDDTDAKRAQSMVVQHSKMAALGVLASSIAHEVKQPLNVMRIGISNLTTRMQGNDLNPAYLSKKLHLLHAQINRATRIVDDMNNFSRKSDSGMVVFSPIKAVEGALSLLSATARKQGVSVRTHFDLGTVMVNGYPNQVEQVFVNLLSNSMEAIAQRRKRGEPCGVISINAGQCDGMLSIFVEDDGGGVPESKLGELFVPFYTTKAAGEGTGLGLPISLRIIKQMDGHIVAEPGEKGLRMVVELPTVTLPERGFPCGER